MNDLVRILAGIAIVVFMVVLALTFGRMPKGPTDA